MIKKWLVLMFFASNAFANGNGDNSPEAKVFSILVVFGVLFILGIINQSKKPKEITKDRLESLKAESDEFFAKLKNGEITEGPDTSLILKNNEVACLQEDSILYESRSKRIYAGTGTRIKGIYIGGGESTSVSQLKKIDQGTLTLTNQGLVFVGGLETRYFKFGQINAIKAWADAIEISSMKKQKNSLFEVRNPFIWEIYAKLLISGKVKVSSRKPRNKGSQKLP